MKAIQFNDYGGPDVLQLVDVELPNAGPGEVRIRVRAAGVNPSDWKRREGKYRAFEEILFPAGVGVEGAGIIDQIGPGVTDVTIGDSVFGFGRNMLAEQAILTHWARKPDILSFEVAAGLPVISDTATRALDQVGVAAGQGLLVSGAAGGVGTAHGGSDNRSCPRHRRASMRAPRRCRASPDARAPPIPGRRRRTSRC